ncbi:hypothetical protein HAX54_009106 [Datura stramonium]|uniref:Uncharacterized protein n=1 Tax=Datura stramonium TaxID=4076 RepID=A0ABS8RWM2_DATST|nr:hypothetical protein [Datura stramonium]
MEMHNNDRDICEYPIFFHHSRGALCFLLVHINLRLSILIYVTLHKIPNSATSHVSDLVSSGIVTSDSDGLTVLQKFLVKYVHQMNSAIPVVHKIKNQINDIRQQGALVDCVSSFLIYELDFVAENGKLVDELVSRAKTALAMLASVTTTQNDEVSGRFLGKMPAWVSSRDRKLLESWGKDIKANAVVAQDGSELSNTC